MQCMEKRHAKAYNFFKNGKCLLLAVFTALKKPSLFFYKIVTTFRRHQRRLYVLKGAFDVATLS
jgi:hypothetical protein